MQDDKFKNFDKWFQISWESTGRFWNRIGGMPDFKGKRILDLGCGLGAQSFQIAQHFPEKILGIDIEPTNIEYAIIKLQKDFHEYSNKITFLCKDISCIPDSEKFDIVLCKDSFEHIINIDEVLNSISRHLVKNGRVYIGFGPLYSSPYGDHKWTYSKIPWGHLIFPESFILKRISKKKGKTINSIEEIGLNKLNLKRYINAFKKSGMRITNLKTNCGNSPIYKLSRILAKISFLADYFTFNMYCILEKD